MKRSQNALFASLVAATIAGSGLCHPVVAAPPTAPAISPDAVAAVTAMGKTLQATAFSMQVRTIRVTNQNGDWVHIFHASKVTVRRPDDLLVVRTGDDGESDLSFDGKTLVVALDGGKKFASVPMPGTIEGMLREAVGKLGVDFPIADLFTSDPAKAVMAGVTAGREVGTATIDGVVCRHLLLTQRGIQVELWIEDNEKALPRRLIVTYFSVRGSPEFIAQFSDWNFDVHPSDTDFSFQPPSGAVKVRLRPARAEGGK